MTNNSTAVSNVIQFRFEAKEVRTILIDEQPWFVAADVCASLAIGNVSLAVNGRADRDADGLDDDEKGIATVNTTSGAQEMLVVNESGLYALIFKSRKAEAKRFKKWVTAEVLPSIRKHGRYEDSQKKMPSLMNKLIGMTELNVIKGLIRDKAKSVPAAMQQSFALTMHRRLHTRFNVPRSELIPASQFDQACNFIGSYALEGEYLPHQSIGIPEKLGQTERYLVSAGPNGERQVTSVPFDACIMTVPKLIGLLGKSSELMVTTDDLFLALHAIADRLHGRSSVQVRRVAA